MAQLTLYNLVNGGGAVDPYLGFNGIYLSYIVKGTASLTGNLTFNSTTAIEGASFIVRWEAIATLNAFSVAICGITFNQSDLNQSGTFDCYYSGGAWTVQYFADASDQPQVYYGINAVTASTSGTTTWVAGVSKSYQRISGGPTTLVGNLIYTAATAGVKDGTPFTVEIAGGITLAASTLTVFGVSISAYDALTGGVKVDAVFDATAGVWRATGTSKVVALAAFQSIGGRTVLVNPIGSAQSPQALEFQTDGDVLFRTGGALVASKLGPENFTTDFYGERYFMVPVSNSEVLAIFTTPKALGIAPGSATKIVMPSIILLEVIYATAPFAANTTLYIRYVGASNALFQQVGGISTATSNIYLFAPVSGGMSTSQILKNTDLELTSLGGNPTSGGGSIKIHVFYKQPTLS